MVSSIGRRDPGGERGDFEECGEEDEEGEFVGYEGGLGIEECALLCKFLYIFVIWSFVFGGREGRGYVNFVKERIKLINVKYDIGLRCNHANHYQISGYLCTHGSFWGCG